ncbi:MAG: translation elongation factor Ts [Candidatus Buchananbacteria bacterium]
MAIDTKAISKIREITGAGISDCKAALTEAGDDMDKAVEILRKKGAIKAAKKLAEREAKQGVVESYIHANGKVGVLIQVHCETDFVALNQEFKNLVHDLAMQIAGANPLYVKPEDVPEEVIAKEKEIYSEQLKNEGKPENMIERIMTGKIDKYFQEVCLLRQPFIKDDKIIIEDLIKNYIAKLGEKIEVARFCRYQI